MDKIISGYVLTSKNATLPICGPLLLSDALKIREKYEALGIAVLFGSEVKVLKSAKFSSKLVNTNTICIVA